MALDYGERRTGIAVTDPLQIIATPLTTVETKDLFSFLQNYFQKEEVEEIVVGMPMDLRGNPTHGTPLVARVLEELAKKFPDLRINTIDERFTSKIAKRAIAQSGMPKNKRKDKKLVDKTSASLILQTYLEKKS